MTGSFLKVGLLTISDRAYKGEYEDQSGVARKNGCKQRYSNFAENSARTSKEKFCLGYDKKLSLIGNFNRNL